MPFLMSLLIAPAVFAAPGAAFAKPTTIEVNSDQVIAACGHSIRVLPNGAVGCINRPCGSTTCDYVCVPNGCFVTIYLATNGRGGSLGVGQGFTLAHPALPAQPPPTLTTPGSGMGIVHAPKGQGNGQGPKGGVP
jgi:hypothetical protein